MELPHSLPPSKSTRDPPSPARHQTPEVSQWIASSRSVGPVTLRPSVALRCLCRFGTLPFLHTELNPSSKKTWNKFQTRIGLKRKQIISLPRPPLVGSRAGRAPYWGHRAQALRILGLNPVRGSYKLWNFEQNLDLWNPGFLIRKIRIILCIQLFSIVFVKHLQSSGSPWGLHSHSLHSLRYSGRVSLHSSALWQGVLHLHAPALRRWPLLLSQRKEVARERQLPRPQVSAPGLRLPSSWTRPISWPLQWSPQLWPGRLGSTDYSLPLSNRPLSNWPLGLLKYLMIWGFVLKKKRTLHWVHSRFCLGISVFPPSQIPYKACLAHHLLLLNPQSLPSSHHSPRGGLGTPLSSLPTHTVGYPILLELQLVQMLRTSKLWL